MEEQAVEQAVFEITIQIVASLLFQTGLAFTLTASSRYAKAVSAHFQLWVCSVGSHCLINNVGTPFRKTIYLANSRLFLLSFRR